MEAWQVLLAGIKDFQPLVATALACVAGAWTLRRHHVRREDDPRIQLRVSVRFVGHHKGRWVAELLAIVENRGEVPHRMDRLAINLRGLSDGDCMIADPDNTYRGQLVFGHPLVPPKDEPATGPWQSLMPGGKDAHVLLYPGTSMRYMYVTSIADTMRFVLIHGELLRPDAEPIRSDRVMKVPAGPAAAV